ncbi:MAG: 3'(2'),5'-bisphosphate nucleotidase CysQ [Pirellulaceae bacterium]|jgi:3'(2'), 5'-bisphosphate nucleotidase|nr:3'(2'),5'-bisphosphate nucleotidase [Planctomycetota bacterium]
MKVDKAEIEAIQTLAREAGEKILTVYHSDDFDVEAKGDGSPLTRADRLAHEHIVAGLAELTPEIPILSEESESSDYDLRKDWDVFWLVDPLDGTKEFIKRNDEFTVNIALIVDRVPVFGVVVAPVLGTCYCGGAEYGGWLVDRDGKHRTLQVRIYSGGTATVIASRSHRGLAVDAFLAALTASEQEPEVRSMGSSLKICLVAEGVADVYPRLGPTSEWDTAAAHAVVLGAGGNVTDAAGDPLRYNKPSILNPWFIVSGGGGYHWSQLVPQTEDGE